MMVLKAVKLVARLVCILLAVWLVYALVGSTLPYTFQKTVAAGKKRELDQVSVLAGDGPGPDRALVVETPTDALGIRMAVVRAAAETLDITNHIIRDSASTRAYLGEILAAAERGVQVRLLLDGKACLVDKGMVDMLRAMDSHPNISCRLYNPVNPLKPWRFHALLHDKFLVADGRMLLLGGRNIDQRHFAPSGFTRSTTHDRDVFIWQSGQPTAEDPGAAAQMTAYMDTLWGYELTRPVAGRPMRAEKAERALALLSQAAADFEQTDPGFYEKSLADYKGATVETRRVTLLHNPIEAENKEPWLAWQLARLALGARQQVVLQTPYATGNADLLGTMEQVAGKARLVMLTNSPASTPNLPAYSNYYGHRQKFLEAGAEIWEYQQTDSIHGKSLVIDGRLSAVGSLNMDDRSFYLDTETMLVIDSPQFAARLLAEVEGLRAQSLQVGPDGAYLPDDAVPMQAAAPVKLAMMRAVYRLMRPFQFLL